jgi:hypothetical protein
MRILTGCGIRNKAGKRTAEAVLLMEMSLEGGQLRTPNAICHVRDPFSPAENTANCPIRSCHPRRTPLYGKHSKQNPGEPSPHPEKTQAISSKSCHAFRMLGIMNTWFLKQ